MMQETYIDEVITLNTQSSTQWDGFKHYGYVDYPTKGLNTFHGGLTQKQAADVKKRKFGIQSASPSAFTRVLGLPVIPSNPQPPPATR